MINAPTISTPSVEAQRTFSKELNKLRRNQQILTILVLLFIAMAFWIVVSLFSSARTSKVSPDVKQLAIPLNPTLDTEVIDKLETRKTFSEDELASFPIYVILQDPRSQEETIAPVGTTIALPSTPVSRPATTSSQLQNFVNTPVQPAQDEQQETPAEPEAETP